MKKMMSAIVAAMMVIGGITLTGCGDESGSGASSAASAAKLYAKARYGGDADALFQLLPESGIKYLENFSYLTEERVKEEIKEYVQRKKIDYENFVAINFEDQDNISRLNKSLAEMGIGKVDKACSVTFCLTNDDYKPIDLDVGEEFGEIGVYEMDGRWYVLDILFIGEDALE